MTQQPEQSVPGITYAAAGVDTAAGDRAVALMKDAVAATMTPAVVGGVGGFAGLVDVSALRDYRRPLLATSTDGVGTKVAIAQALDIHDTIGQDLVGMVVDDIVVVGARPLLMTDYIACGHVVPERIADIVRGVAQACAAVGTPLLGGETAEHPGLMAPDEYDVAGAATGVVEADRMLGAEKVHAGDVLVALGSSGLHSNGYSLVRRVIEHAGWDLEREVPEFGRALGQELLEPTRLYTRVCLAMLETLSSPAAPGPVHALSHITGGGLAANVARVLPAGLIADVDRASWTVPPVFSTVRELGSVPWEDLEGTLNLGVGMVAVVDPSAVDAILRVAEGSDIPAWVLGEVHEARTYEAQDCVVSGTKGVDGGAVDIHGAYRTS
ncbi:phosphoribosylformylglycinamidine cyclo-ligase [Actinomyces naeslundii]|uniref:phosphoribosylformylglycinamidine cyclo-ligase n=1 Tax=Actinomyces naeslundii TaxID=1655 RepID=UPI00094DAF73|nr:phosphoribosylformylglycinamidine cyclo-ligase [Actinomyces naeslundii]OLO92869.1 phosphoribosylformylglycinamidine cyclo-ligase [Actinomyces naeslundii]